MQVVERSWLRRWESTELNCKSLIGETADRAPLEIRFDRLSWLENAKAALIPQVRNARLWP